MSQSAPWDKCLNGNSVCMEVWYVTSATVCHAHTEDRRKLSASKSLFVCLLPYGFLKLPCIWLHRLLKFFKNPLITEAYRRTFSVNFLLLVILSRFHRQLDLFLLALLCNSDVGRHKGTAFRSTYLLNALWTRSSMLRWNHNALCISHRRGKGALPYFTSLCCPVGKGDFSVWELMYRQRCC